MLPLLTQLQINLHHADVGVRIHGKTNLIINHHNQNLAGVDRRLVHNQLALEEGLLVAQLQQIHLNRLQLLNHMRSRQQVASSDKILRLVTILEKKEMTIER